MIAKSIILILLSFDFYLPEKVHFQKTGTVEFNVGFVANHRFRGILQDSISDQHLFYFGDPVSRKVIKVFDQHGDLRFDVPLQESIRALNEIETFEVKSADTILVFGKQNNKIVIIDHSGKVWRTIALDSVIRPYNNLYLKYRPSAIGHSLYGRMCVLKVEYQSRGVNEPSPTIQEYFPESLDLPYFLKIENIYSADDLIYSWGQFGFYRQFMNDTLAMAELPTYSFEQNISQVFSIYSDSLYIVNNVDLALKVKFKIVSKDTDIGSHPLNLRMFSKYEQYLNEIKYEGHIVKSLYDPINDCYVVSVACENKEKIPLPRRYTYCILDSDGKQLAELKLGDSNSQGLMYYFDGIYYVSNTDFENESDKNTVVRYDMLSLHL